MRVLLGSLLCLIMPYFSIRLIGGANMLLQFHLLNYYTPCIDRPSNDTSS